MSQHTPQMMAVIFLASSSEYTPKKAVITTPSGDVLYLTASYDYNNWEHKLTLPKGTRVEIHEEEDDEA